jgi:hypothetical protein
MARGKLTLYDVPSDQRAKGAAEARKSTLQMLSNPHLSSSQKEELRERLRWISKLESCDISETLGKPEVREPVNHDVEVTEDLSVTET